MNAWKIVRTATTYDDASTVELYYATFGKGRTRTYSWKIFRNGKCVGYASTATDADINFERVMSGLVYDCEAGRYVPFLPDPAGTHVHAVSGHETTVHTYPEGLTP